MSDYPYPYATELLHALMGVGGEDAQLPLEVLVNLNRNQLREPLRVLAGMIKPEAVPKTREARLQFAANMDAELAAEYPLVQREFIYAPYLWSALSRAEYYLDYTYHLPEVEALYEAEPMVWALLCYTSAAESEGGYWSTAVPVAALYPLTWGPEYYAAFLPILDTLLSEGPETRRMILELAGLDEVAAISPLWALPTTLPSDELAVNPDPGFFRELIYGLGEAAHTVWNALVARVRSRR